MNSLDIKQLGRRWINRNEKRPSHACKRDERLPGSEHRQHAPLALVDTADRFPEAIHNAAVGDFVEDEVVDESQDFVGQVSQQLRDTIEAFDSVWLRALVRRSDKLAALIPQLYVKGLSTRHRFRLGPD